METIRTSRVKSIRKENIIRSKSIQSNRIGKAKHSVRQRAQAEGRRQRG